MLRRRNARGRTPAGRWRLCDRHHRLAPNPLSSSPDRAEPHRESVDRAAGSECSRAPVFPSASPTSASETIGSRARSPRESPVAPLPALRAHRCDGSRGTATGERSHRSTEGAPNEFSLARIAISGHSPPLTLLRAQLMAYRRLFSLAVALGIAPATLAAQGAFGSALAVTGREVYVGQPDNTYGPGVVYVFRPDAKGVWRVATKITRSGASNGDGFGSALAIDGNTMLVGDAKADSESGVVYVFTRDANGAWHESGTIKPRERHPADAFGAGVGLSGDRAYVSTWVRGFGSMVFTLRRWSGF